MKKVYLIIVALAMQNLLMAQKLQHVNKAPGDTLHYEDFSDSTLSNWTVIDSSNLGHNWIWSTMAPGGQYSTLAPPINSTTGANGFISMRADFYNTPFPPMGPVPMDAWIISKAIPITPSPTVEIEYNQFIYYCCRVYPGDKIEMHVSKDSVNWAVFGSVQSNLGRSSWSPNPNIQSFDISSILANEDTAYIRFRFSGPFAHFWMIDDLLIQEGPGIVGIDDNLYSSSLKVYPNPSNGQLVIETNENAFQRFEIRNTLGAVVYQDIIIGQRMQLDLSHLERGLYFISLIGADTREVRKILLE